MKKIRYICLLLALLTLPASARTVTPATGAEAAASDSWQKWGPTTGLTGGGFIARIGYVIGGTTPLPLPAEIRKVNSFSPKGGVGIGIDGYRMFSKRWGISMGLHFFWEGFSTSADVKGLYVWLKQGPDEVKGYFTGTNATSTEMWGVTLPLLATLRISPRWNVSFGPYLSYYFEQTFSGQVYDNDQHVGYLRLETPTGTKQPINRDTPQSYPEDFPSHMLPLSAGIEVGVDWKALRHMNVFASLDWGLTNIWQNNFEGIPFKMYPIYGTVGVAYRY